MAELSETQKTEMKLNLNAIKKSDKFVVKILDHASQVALYKFQAETQAWVCRKTDLSGPSCCFDSSDHLVCR